MVRAHQRKGTVGAVEGPRVAKVGAKNGMRHHISLHFCRTINAIMKEKNHSIVQIYRKMLRRENLLVNEEALRFVKSSTSGVKLIFSSPFFVLRFAF